MQATLVLDSEGKRLLAKYYVPPAFPSAASELASKTVTDQRAFERKLVSKTKGLNGDVVVLDNHLILYKQLADTLFYLVAPVDESEAMIYQALITLRDSVDSLLGHQVDRASVLEHYDRVALAVDEVVDNGVILETESYNVAQRTTKEASEELSVNLDLSEKGIRSMFDFAKGRLTQAVRQQLT